MIVGHLAGVLFAIIYIVMMAFGAMFLQLSNNFIGVFERLAVSYIAGFAVLLLFLIIKASKERIVIRDIKLSLMRTVLIAITISSMVHVIDFNFDIVMGIYCVAPFATLVIVSLIRKINKIVGMAMFAVAMVATTVILYATTRSIINSCYAALYITSYTFLNVNTRILSQNEQCMTQNCLSFGLIILIMLSFLQNSVYTIIESVPIYELFILCAAGIIRVVAYVMLFLAFRFGKFCTVMLAVCYYPLMLCFAKCCAGEIVLDGQSTSVMLLSPAFFFIILRMLENKLHLNYIFGRKNLHSKTEMHFLASSLPCTMRT